MNIFKVKLGISQFKRDGEKPVSVSNISKDNN